MTLLDRLDRLLARRVEQADQAQENEISRQVAGSEAARLDAGTLEPSEPKHALALSGELIGGAHKVCPIDRLALTAGGLLSVAMLKDDFGRALDEEEFLAVRGLVQCGHELVLRLERDGVDARETRHFRSPFHPELGRERIERPLGRVAFDLPNAVLLKQLRIIAEHGYAPHELEHRLLPRALSVPRDLTLRGITIAADLINRLGGDGGHRHHFHQRQGAGLV